MKEFAQRVMIVLMTVVFTAAVLRVSTNSLMSAEEELIEHIEKAAKNRDSDGFNFFEIFGGEQCFILVAAKDCHFNNRNNGSLNYQDPLIDIPLMPPELKM